MSHEKGIEAAKVEFWKVGTDFDTAFLAAIKAYLDASGMVMVPRDPVAWRYRYLDGSGKWTVQKNKPAWYRDDMRDVELEPLFAQFQTPEESREKK